MESEEAGFSVVCGGTSKGKNPIFLYIKRGGSTETLFEGEDESYMFVLLEIFRK